MKPINFIQEANFPLLTSTHLRLTFMELISMSGVALLASLHPDTQLALKNSQPTVSLLFSLSMDATPNVLDHSVKLRLFMVLI